MPKTKKEVEAKAKKVKAEAEKEAEVKAKAEKKAKAEAKAKAKEDKENKEYKIVDANNKLIRIYDTKNHGKDASKLAGQFVKKFKHFKIADVEEPRKDESNSTSTIGEKQV